MLNDTDGSFFEVSFSESAVKEKPNLSSSFRCKGTPTADEISERLLAASERREELLQETRQKSLEHAENAERIRKLQCEKESSIRERLEMDIALKSKRRDQIIEAKLQSVKKQLNRVDNVAQLRNSFTEEQSNKENAGDGTCDKVLQKLAFAEARRSQGIQETKTRNSELVNRAMTVMERERQRREDRRTEMLQSVERDLTEKAERREQLLQVKIRSAKKEVEKVTEVRSRKSLGANHSIS